MGVIGGSGQARPANHNGQPRGVFGKVFKDACFALACSLQYNSSTVRIFPPQGNIYYVSSTFHTDMGVHVASVADALGVRSVLHQTINQPKNAGTLAEAVRRALTDRRTGLVFVDWYYSHEVWGLRLPRMVPIIDATTVYSELVQPYSMNTSYVDAKKYIWMALILMLCKRPSA